MAGNDTAALVVALSAQLTKFEKDMKGAVDIADKRTKEIETRFAATNTAINNKLNSISASARSNIGFLGDILSSLGGKGTAAAVALGVVAGAVIFLARQTADFADKAKALKEGAETAGLTVTQLKALGSAGKTVGLDFEETVAFFTKFIANLGELRNGTGPLYDALLKVDVGLLRQLSTTRDSAKAIDLLVAAFARLDDQTKKLDLAKAAGGRAGLTGVRLLENLATNGGVAGAVAQIGPVDEGQIDRARQLKVEIDDIERKTKNIWGGMFSDHILNTEKAFAIVMNEIAQAVERVVGAKERSKALGDLQPATFNERFGNFPTPTRLTVNKPPEPAAGGGSPSVELAILQKNLALLGESVTQGEEWKRKRLEIAAAAEKGGLMDGIAQRALAAFNLTMKTAALATRERLAVATEQQIVEVKLAQLAQDRVKFGLTDNEVQMATVVILREAKDAADALTVRRAYLPGLKQLEIDAQNTRKAIDEVAVNSLNSLGDAAADALMHTKSISDAFRDMANSIIRDMIRMALKKAVLGPLAGALGGLFGGIGGGTGAGAGALAGAGAVGIGTNAEGTDSWRGGPTWVGERGPEIVNLPRGAQVIPNDAARRSVGTNVNVNIHQNLGGAAGDETVRRIAFEATQRGMRQVLAQVPGISVRANAEHAQRYS